MASRYHGLFDIFGLGLELELELKVLIVRSGRRGDIDYLNNEIEDSRLRSSISCYLCAFNVNAKIANSISDINSRYSMLCSED